MSKKNNRKPVREGVSHKVGRVGAVPVGRGATVQLKDGCEVALYNVDGSYYAIENFCPHKGFPLADSRLYGNIVECDHHGWRFSVATGACFTKPKCAIESYEVRIEDGWIYVVI